MNLSLLIRMLLIAEIGAAYLKLRPKGCVQSDWEDTPGFWLSWSARARRSIRDDIRQRGAGEKNAVRHPSSQPLAAVLEVLVLKELRGLSPPLGAAERADWLTGAPPACLPGSAKKAHVCSCCDVSWAASRRTDRRWLMPTPLNNTTTTSTPRPPSLLFLVVCAKSPAPDGRTQFDGTNQRHCGGNIQEKKSHPKQTWIFNRHLISSPFFNLFVFCFLFSLVMLALHRGC